MLSTYQLKSRFQSLLRPLAVWLYRAGVTANQITVATCVISALLGAAALQSAQPVLFLLIAIWCLLRMAANALDGMLAREFGQVSRLGAVLNELGDVISDIALYLPFAFVTGSNSWLVVAIVLLALFAEFTGVLGLTIGTERRFDGPMGKSDRALVFGVTGLLIGCNAQITPYLNAIWLAIIALLILTIFNRLQRSLAETRGR